ncbi:hypothetical protein NDU88_003062 [Pleurodeles waltl]|uniref:Uncharacterized protein n=1 Tax=Pleurodeles waltl TaxID=8319 RepID=A0AAV7LE87_PLEWA|nr:hypothetical protein NDU88_003062 [Pleurodeles waltl]
MCDACVFGFGLCCMPSAQSSLCARESPKSAPGWTPTGVPSCFTGTHILSPTPEKHGPPRGAPGPHPDGNPSACGADRNAEMIPAPLPLTPHEKEPDPSPPLKALFSASRGLITCTVMSPGCGRSGQGEGTGLV